MHELLRNWPLYPSSATREVDGDENSSASCKFDNVIEGKKKKTRKMCWKSFCVRMLTNISCAKHHLGLAYDNVMK